jgi:arylsulfatase
VGAGFSVAKPIWRFVFVQQKVANPAKAPIDFSPMQPSAGFNPSAIKEQIEKAMASRAGQQRLDLKRHQN